MIGGACQRNGTSLHGERASPPRSQRAQARTATGLEGVEREETQPASEMHDAMREAILGPRGPSPGAERAAWAASRNASLAGAVMTQSATRW